MSFLDAHRTATQAARPAGPLLGTLAELPAVREFLSADCYPDGTVRERSTVTFFCEDGVVKACLSDRDQARTLWRTGRGVEDVLLLLEAALVDGTADWRKSGGASRQAQKKK